MCKLKLFQQAFAHHFGFSTRGVQRWEQEQAVLDRQSRILLRLGD
jgi:DNA-binding transcriptional regulator YiaG